MSQTFEIKNRFTGAVLFSYELQDGQESGMIARHAAEAAIASGANLRGADLGGANLRDADLGGANLRGADLGGANLRDADLRGADLRGADLGGANLRGADLRGADLGGANLRDANLRDADLGGANLRDADLGGANLRGADLGGAIGDMEYIKSMQFDTWRITYTSTHLSIGCQSHPIDDWKDWKNKPVWIAAMAGGASEWAEKYLDLVLQIIEISPATPCAIESDEVTK